MAAAPHNRWVILLTFLLALMLSAMPLPEYVEWGRPQWVALTLIYWVAALPNRVGPWQAWMLGLLLDILQGSLLGIHALSLAVIAYIIQLLHRRFRMYPVWQQAMLVLVLIGTYQMALQWAQTLTGTGSDTLLFLLPSLISTLIWPWLFVVLRSVRRALQVR
ncbi:rod shape-determining protein MreD [Motiliproteus sediminis]|uniref:rod shape-determining protein MreD n=1 Tax=Motiliproteus sediminis TaxID=1468178 RepID=UPI001AF013B4|nr:rod shape-determining protein MreD [Motiliproteus sediminis]